MICETTWHDRNNLLQLFAIATGNNYHIVLQRITIIGISTHHITICLTMLQTHIAGEQSSLAPKPASWSALLDSARAGCDDSLGQIFEKVHFYLTLCAQRNIGPMLRSKFGPSDIVQISMMEAQQSFDSFAGDTEAEMRSWLKRIVMNNLTDESRRFTQTRCRNVNREQSIAETNNGMAVDTSTSSSILCKQEDDERLTSALARLPLHLQQVVEARHRFGFSFRQISDHLAVTEWTARSQYNAATNQLRRWLAESDD